MHARPPYFLLFFISIFVLYMLARSCTCASSAKFNMHIKTKTAGQSALHAHLRLRLGSFFLHFSKLWRNCHARNTQRYFIVMCAQPCFISWPQANNTSMICMARPLVASLLTLVDARIRDSLHCLPPCIMHGHISSGKCCSSSSGPSPLSVLPITRGSFYSSLVDGIFVLFQALACADIVGVNLILSYIHDFSFGWFREARCRVFFLESCAFLCPSRHTGSPKCLCLQQSFFPSFSVAGTAVARVLQGGNSYYKKVAQSYFLEALRITNCIYKSWYISHASLPQLVWKSSFLHSRSCYFFALSCNQMISS